MVPVTVSEIHPLRRLMRYAGAYRGRLVSATLGMLAYAAASAALAALIKPILDNVLPNQQRLGAMAWAIVLLYLIKGLGSYVSSYLMADVGQRVVMDVRNALYRHVLGQSAGFFAQRTTGQLTSRINNDVGLVQRAVSETIGDLARECGQPFRGTADPVGLDHGDDTRPILARADGTGDHCRAELGRASHPHKQQAVRHFRKTSDGGFPEVLVRREEQTAFRGRKREHLFIGDTRALRPYPQDIVAEATQGLDHRARHVLVGKNPHAR